jgi:hypothetical protein
VVLVALVLGGTAAAQAVPAPRDTTRADTTRRDTTSRVDTARAKRDTAQHAVPMPSDTTHSDTTSDTTQVPKDTIKAPLAHAEMPQLVGIGSQYHWDRDQMFASGAINLLDLLKLIPGVTAFRSGWITSPQYAAYLGNPARVRYFYDGIEIENLDPRSPGALDASEVQLFSLEEVSVERGADELRVYLRSWRVQRTSTNTRVDVLTGDEGTNLYRGFYGKRYGNGMALQLAGQQYGTNSDPTIGGGDELALTGRLGWAKGPWSIDAYAIRSSRSRDEQDQDLVASVNGVVSEQDRTRTDAYLRAGYGDPDSGSWAQVMVATEQFAEHSPFHPQLDFAPADSADTTMSAKQVVATGGFTRWGLRLSAADRLHLLPNSSTMNSLEARLAYERKELAVSFFADYRGPDTTSTEEASARFTPLDFFSVTGAVTHRHGGGADGGEQVAVRLEAGLKVFNTWLTGGILRRDATFVPGLSAYDTSFVARRAVPATGIYGTINGKFYKDIGADVWGVRYSNNGYYRPQVQTREELYLDTKWLSRFPSGNFGFRGSIAHEFRQNVLFPTTTTDETFDNNAPFAVFSHVLVGSIEVRIIDAVIFFHSIYGINPPIYEIVPGYAQPRQLLTYGVRWQFWN